MKYTARKKDNKIIVVDDKNQEYPISDTSDITEGETFEENEVEGYMFGGNNDGLGYLVIKNHSI